MDKVIIKARSDEEHPELKAKYVGAKEYVPVKTGPDGKLITGFDENALDILQLEDEAAKKKIKADIQKVRKELETLLNVDLDSTSPFWDDFYVIVEDGLVLDQTNPRHRVNEIFLVANKIVAPNEEAIQNDENFQSCLFFIHREELETSKAAKKALDIDKVTSQVYNIAETAPARLLNIYSYLFGYDAKGSVLADTAYLKIKELLTVTNKEDLKKNLKRVKEAVDMKPENLNTKITLDKAIKKKIVSTKGNIYRRGDIILGNDFDEALEYLSASENSAELISLKKEVDKDKAK